MVLILRCYCILSYAFLCYRILPHLILSYPNPRYLALPCLTLPSYLSIFQSSNLPMYLQPVYLFRVYNYIPFFTSLPLYLSVAFSCLCFSATCQGCSLRRRSKEVPSRRKMVRQIPRMARGLRLRSGFCLQCCHFAIFSSSNNFR